VGAPFARGDVQESFGILLMKQRDPRQDKPQEIAQMPPLATELVDEAGVDALTALVQSL
jgi:hypothetical protein